MASWLFRFRDAATVIVTPEQRPSINYFPFSSFLLSLSLFFSFMSISITPSPPCHSLYLSAADPLDGEEYLDIIGIMRNQAGRYECKASNDVKSDVKYVNVVVNCE